MGAVPETLVIVLLYVMTLRFERRLKKKLNKKMSEPFYIAYFLNIRFERPTQVSS